MTCTSISLGTRSSPYPVTLCIPAHGCCNPTHCMNAARTSRRRVAASTICLGLLAVSRIRTIQSIIRRGKGRVNTQLEQLPPLPAKTAEKMQVLLDKCKEVYEPIKMSTAEMEQEMKRYFVPADSSPSAGEVNQLDVARLLVEAGLGPRDSFVDVGSGVGKLVLTAVASTKVGSAWGLELSPFRTEAAKQAVDQLRNLGVLHAQEHARAHFIQGSCGDELPDAVLHATHFMLTIRPVSGRSMSEEGPVNQFLHVLARSRRERQKPCVLWSVNKQLPLSKGMRHVRTVELPGGLNKPPGVWTPPSSQGKKSSRGVRRHAAMGEFGTTRSAPVYEYLLDAG